MFVSWRGSPGLDEASSSASSTGKPINVCDYFRIDNGALSEHW